jgi:hypothetical protein
LQDLSNKTSATVTQEFKINPREHLPKHIQVVIESQYRNLTLQICVGKINHLVSIIDKTSHCVEKQEYLFMHKSKLIWIKYLKMKSKTKGKSKLRRISLRLHDRERVLK